VFTGHEQYCLSIRGAVVGPKKMRCKDSVCIRWGVLLALLIIVVSICVSELAAQHQPESPDGSTVVGSRLSPINPSHASAPTASSPTGSIIARRISGVWAVSDHPSHQHPSSPTNSTYVPGPDADPPPSYPAGLILR
jgi:hypothetical protein